VSLGFLSVEAAPALEMRARSPMERPALKHGARFSLRDGWNVPEAFGEPATERRRITQTVGFADRSRLTKLELQAEPGVLAEIVARATDQGPSGPLALEPTLAGRVVIGRSPATWWCPVTPARVLVLSEPGSAQAVRAALAQAQEHASGTVTLVDVTCGLAALSLMGPDARELLARFCAIDVRPHLTPPAAFRPGSVARTPGYVLVEAPDRLLVLVGWALGEYLWHVVGDAAAELGGGPVGAEALALETADA